MLFVLYWQQYELPQLNKNKQLHWLHISELLGLICNTTEPQSLDMINDDPNRIIVHCFFQGGDRSS